jgi:hypothetical protein
MVPFVSSFFYPQILPDIMLISVRNLACLLQVARTSYIILFGLIKREKKRMVRADKRNLAGTLDPGKPNDLSFPASPVPRTIWP